MVVCEYNYYYGYCKVFRASKTINGPAFFKQSLNSTYPKDKKNNNSVNNHHNPNFQEVKEDVKKRSKSLSKSSFQFKKKGNEFSEQEKKYLYSDIKNIPGLTKSICTKIFGLENLGNTCFLNSSLQIIFHSPIFIEKFLEDISKFKPNNDTISYEFFNFIIDIAYKDQKLFSPKKIISRFTKKSDMFSLGQQTTIRLSKIL